MYTKNSIFRTESNKGFSDLNLLSTKYLHHINDITQIPDDMKTDQISINQLETLKTPYLDINNSYKYPSENPFKVDHNYAFNHKFNGTRYSSNKLPHINENELIIPNMEPDPRGDSIGNFPLHKLREHTLLRSKNINWSDGNDNAVPTGESSPLKPNKQIQYVRKNVSERVNDASNIYFGDELEQQTKTGYSNERTDYDILNKIENDSKRGLTYFDEKTQPRKVNEEQRYRELKNNEILSQKKEKSTINSFTKSGGINTLHSQKQITNIVQDIISSDSKYTINHPAQMIICLNNVINKKYKDFDHIISDLSISRDQNSRYRMIDHKYNKLLRKQSKSHYNEYNDNIKIKNNYKETIIDHNLKKKTSHDLPPQLFIDLNEQMRKQNHNLFNNNNIKKKKRSDKIDITNYIEKPHYKEIKTDHNVKKKFTIYDNISVNQSLIPFHYENIEHIPDPINNRKNTDNTVPSYNSDYNIKHLRNHDIPNNSFDQKFKTVGEIMLSDKEFKSYNRNYRNIDHINQFKNKIETMKYRQPEYENKTNIYGANSSYSGKNSSNDIMSSLKDETESLFSEIQTPLRKR